MITIEQIKELIPKKVYLYYIDRNDSFDEHIDILQQQMYSEDDVLFDFVELSDYESVEEIISTLKNDLKAKHPNIDIEEYIDSNRDEITDIIRDRDHSNPISDLLSNTYSYPMFYDTGLFIEESEANSRKTFLSIKRRLKIKSNVYDDAIREMMSNASYGGMLVIYFLPDDWDDFMYRIPREFNTVSFSGNVCVAIINNYNGSGDHTYLNNFQIKNLCIDKNIFIDKAVKYSYVHEVCGLYSDFCKDTNYELSLNEKIKCKKNESAILNKINEEKELDKVFASGSCTPFDMDIKRHRHVVYTNDYPCGNKCTKCGTFWID